MKVVNELSPVATPDGVQLELGAFYSGEVRRLVITFDVPGIAALGLAKIAGLEFTWVELPGLVQHSVTVPVHINVLPPGPGRGPGPGPGGPYRTCLPTDPAGETGCSGEDVTG